MKQVEGIKFHNEKWYIIVDEEEIEWPQKALINFLKTFGVKVEGESND